MPQDRDKKRRAAFHGAPSLSARGWNGGYGYSAQG
jgi:hypothetical protein